MTLTRPIPLEARPVLKVIRNSSERPAALPGPGDEVAMRWIIGRDYYCPMGLCACAMRGDPVVMLDFIGNDKFGKYPDLSDDAVYEFSDWWDEQTDPQAAVDAVWGKTGETK